MIYLGLKMKNKIRQFLRNIKYNSILYLYKIRGYDMGKNVVIGKKGNIEKLGFKAGSNIYIGPYHYIAPNVEIGDFCLISDNLHIVGHDHIFEKVGTPTILAGRPENQPKTILEKDVWIGHAVTIMRGVKIGEGSIIGANSLVTKDIPPYSIYAGYPAKFIRMRFSSENDRKNHSIKINQISKEKINVN